MSLALAGGGIRGAVGAFGVVLCVRVPVEDLEEPQITSSEKCKID